MRQMRVRRLSDSLRGPRAGEVQSWGCGADLAFPNRGGFLPSTAAARYKKELVLSLGRRGRLVLGQVSFNFPSVGVNCELVRNAKITA